MFCKNCGFQNAEGTKFCVSCGTNLTEDTQQTPKPNVTPVDVHNSVIRKSIKKAAKSKPKGALIGGFFLYILIIMALVFVLSLTLFNTVIDPSVTNAFAVIIVALLMEAIFVFLSSGFSVGYSKATLDVARGETIKATQIVTYPIKNFKLVLKVFAVLAIYTLLSYVLAMIPILGAIALMVITIYVTPALAISYFVVIDNEDITIKELITKSLDLVKGHRVAYYALIISFIGWYCLSPFTLNILALWILPYMMISIANFYRYLIGEEKFNTEEKGLSDAAIIIITVVSYFAILIIVIIACLTLAVTAFGSTMSSAVDELKNDGWQIITEENKQKEHHDSYQTKTYNTLTFDIPSDFKETSVPNYEVAYANKSMTKLFSVLTTDAVNGADAKTFADTYRGILASNYAVTTVQEKKIASTTWYTMDCTDSGISMKLYVAENSNKYYVAVISYDNTETDLDFVEKIANSLSFTNAV